jgi:hypothetical protein
MSNILFIINSYDNVHGFFTDLEKAKDKLKNIYNEISDFKYNDYKISVYNLIDSEYVISNIYYTYIFDKFDKNIIN